MPGHPGGPVTSGERTVNDVDAPVVRLGGLTKTFGAVRGISNVTLEVTAGQVFGFLGPNGAGKSTTIRLLMGLYLPTAGRAELFGLDPLAARARDPAPGRLPARRAGALPAADRPRAPRPLARAAGRRPTERYRDQLVERFDAELDRPVHDAVQGQPAEDRPDPGVHAPPGAARPRRADLRAGPAAAGRVRAPAARRPWPRAHGVPLLARSGRGAAAGPPDRDHPGRAAGRCRHRRGPAPARHRAPSSSLRRSPSTRRASRACPACTSTVATGTRLGARGCRAGRRRCCAAAAPRTRSTSTPARPISTSCS